MKPPRVKDETGNKYSMLTVLKYSHKQNNSHLWLCRCDCGKTKLLKLAEVRNGKIQSCGCLRSRQCAKLKQSHGMSKTPEHNVWILMISRCHNINNKSYSYYGGRGIHVCEKWRNSFKDFFADMGERPSRQHSIERIDNNRGYSPENCVWATKSEQGRNRRHPEGKTGITGITINGSGYLARYTINGVRHSVGTFKTLEGAAKALAQAKTEAGY